MTIAANSQPTATRGRPFAPGKSGNPSGRPRVAQEFRRRARRAVDEMVLDAWIQEVRDRGPAWLRASELLAAYAYGKPSATPDEEPSEPGRTLAALTVNELRQLVAGVRAAIPVSSLAHGA